MHKCINCGKYLQCCRSNPEVTKITIINCDKFIKKQDSLDKFLKYMVIFSIIAIMGAVGSLILEYIAAHGFFDFMACVGAVIIYLCMLGFIGWFIFSIIFFISGKLG